MGKGSRLDFDDVDVRATLPLLAWAVTLRGESATLVSGVGVEIGDGTCFEGAWSTESLDLHSAVVPRRRPDVFFFGSGVVRLSRSQTLFVPPTHTMEGLYLAVSDDGTTITVTNSMIWAMREAGANRLGASHYGVLTAALNSAMSGLLGYKRLLMRTTGASLLRFLYSPFVVDAASGAITEEPTVIPREGGPLTFAAYRDDLLAILWRTWLNASAAGRRNRYARLHSTMSSGYDSTACAALASALGFREPISLDTGRGGTDDTGRLAGAEMGLTVRVFPRPGSGIESKSEVHQDFVVDLEALERATGKSYAEFLVSLTSWGDLVFDGFEPVLPGSVILTGFFASQIWDVPCPTGPWVRRTDSSGAGLGEFRLRTGFVHVPVPFIHCRRWLAIRRLSQSVEMRPFRLGTKYERPIARRLVEEAGASRTSFATEKRAAHVDIEVSPERIAAAYDEVAARYG